MADVCLILEGTYPFVTGGVSSCVYQLVKGTPDISYSLIYIGAHCDDKLEYKYPITPNITSIKKIFLFDYNIPGKITDLKIDFDFNQIKDLHKNIRTNDIVNLKPILQSLFFQETRLCNPYDILSSKQAWDILEFFYKQTNKDISFIDYFYTWRFTHFPLFTVLQADIPKAKMYHALSTGYAGLLGTIAKMKYNVPLMLTEHGIYTNERKIEITMASWIFKTDSTKEINEKINKNEDYFKEWWMSFFNFLSLITYRQADVIVTLYNENKNKQVALGADQSKIKIIQNGIDYKTFSSLVKRKQELNKKINIALIGRVVPIKDIKMFIKTIHIVHSKFSNIIANIIGPTVEDEEYFEECKSLISVLEAGEYIKFKGKVDVKKVYPEIDILVLSSISEGQPMVILEGFAASIPSVTTDVGACKELIYGMGSKDQQIGQAGYVVPFGEEKLLAEGILKLATDDEKRLKFGENGKRRVELFYQENHTIEKYRHEYNLLFD